MAVLSARLSELESRSRGINLIFSGFTDIQTEAWAVSGKKIVDACAEKLGISLATCEIEWAHRLGRFLPS